MPLVALPRGALLPALRAPPVLRAADRAAPVWQTARMEVLLLGSGLAAIAIGTWRGYANARLVVAPLVHPGETTRSAVEATQPVVERARVRRAARNLFAAVAWLLLAMYGLY